MRARVRRAGEGVAEVTQASVTSAPQARARERWSLVIIGAALTAIATATLTPGGQPWSEPSVGCVFCGDRALADVLVNLILFSPLGIGLALHGTRSRRAVLAGGFVSALVECAQLVIPGRDSSIGDIIVNAAGVWAGIALVWLVRELASLEERASARLSFAAALDVMAAVLVIGWLLQPSFPRTDYWGQWTPNLRHLAWYRGRVETVRIAGVEVQSRRIQESAWAREALLSGRRVDVEFTAGPRVSRLASLFSVYDQSGEEIFLIGPDRDDLVVRVRTRAVDWRLTQPDLRAIGGWPDLRAGTALRLSTWSPSRGEWCFDGPAERRCGLGNTIGAGWGVLFYAQWFPNWLRALLAAGWTAALLAPTGFLLRPRWESAAAVSLGVVALALLPGVVALRPTRGIEWVGAAVGLTLGTVAARVVRKGTTFPVRIRDQART
jgi:hypothetical protein